MSSRYGIKIKNIQAATLYEYNLGVRDYFSYTPAMLANSLFSYFLQDNGLKVSKDNRTRDIICLQFDFGTKSYEEAIKGLDALRQGESNEIRSHKLSVLKERMTERKDKFIKLNADAIRDEYYQNGVDIKYLIKNKHDKVVREDIIHYKMLYRSPGKAKDGECMFIADRLYDKAKEYIYMGYELPKENAPIVEASAYVSLVASSIIDTVKIPPEDILILKDIESPFTRDVISIETDENKHCYAKHINNYELHNVLFDGQALMDESIFPKWGDGYVLLRQHMMKAAAFKTNIQLFFRDYFGEDYEQAEVTDMFGNKHKAKDIKLITTDNAVKYLKFGINYDYWCNRVKQDNSLFGIVKTAHKSKLGEVQKMSYQMINCLDMEIMDDVTLVSRNYIYQLKKDLNVFLKYLEDNVTFVNDFDVLLALYNQDPMFAQSEYFRNRRRQIISAYVKKMRTGKVLQEGDNLVMVGSPYAMLLHAVGENVENDKTLISQDDSIQCYTKRFDTGEYLAGFRSPHNSKSNILALQNVGSDLLDKYFYIGKQCIAVNTIHTDLQDRANGCDFDSDSIYCTNHKKIAEYAKKCYKEYPTIVNNIPKEKTKYVCSMLSYSNIDNKLASAQLAIGESSNLAQLALSYSYNNINSECDDYVSILSVLAQWVG